MHVGLIGGIGPAATELYYRGLVAAQQGWTDPTKRMDLTIVQAEARDLVANFTAGRFQEQAEVFAGLIGRLKGAGAEQAAITSLGGHFCMDELRPISPLPLIDALPVINDGLKARGIRKVGLLGTFRVMESGLYGGLTDVDWCAPPGEELQRVHDTYVAMAIPGTVTEPQRDHLFAAGRQMIDEQGAEVVLLSGTDLFLAFDGRDCGYPVIDSADMHIAAIGEALER